MDDWTRQDTKDWLAGLGLALAAFAVLWIFLAACGG